MFEGGSAYMVGKMNGDHWYLYITSPSAGTTPPRTPTDDGSSINGFNGANSNSSTNASSPILRTSKKIPTGILSAPVVDSNEMQDETLEILMTDLDPINAKQFYLEHASAVARDGVVARTNAALRATNNKQAAKDHMSDSTYSITGTEELFDVDDIDANGNSSNGSLTPMSEDHIEIDEALTTEGHALGTVVSDSCGLSDVYPKSAYPDARIDAYMFSPCGFSANGVVPGPAPAEGEAADSKAAAAGMHYFTVHVTPEPNCSFASFETNVPGGQKGRQTADIVKQVVDIFRPGRFSVTLFEAKGKGAPAKDQYFLANDLNGAPSPTGVNKPRLENIPGYRRIDRIVHDFEDYDLVFRFYEREGFVSNGEARVGEL